MNNRQILRAYSIKEVSKMINTPTGTIRQWEKDLEGLLVIPRTQQGARYYTDEEINILNKIKEMRSQNVSKGMIRSLLEKHLNGEGDEPVSEPSSEPLETSNLPSQEVALAPVEQMKELQASNIAAFYTAMADFKQDLLTEFKHELQMSKHELLDEVKNEVSNSTLITVKEISKSIQRSNDKQKANVHEISNMIMKASEHTSESIGTLSEEIVKGSEAAYDKLSDRLTETVKLTDRRNHKAIEKVANTLKETKEDMGNLSVELESKQKTILESIHELKESQEEIRKREEHFQTMIESYREVAATKRNRKWWKIWS
ncbi:MerR family transcriptional regulator [Niallia sp. Krafla_26]|uniref:MerR family transcriptional regulator n=1 Tax=Niallia sp. Krafla_26 TaxID=3064703 RepID=UPI003D1690F1